MTRGAKLLALGVSITMLAAACSSSSSSKTSSSDTGSSSSSGASGSSGTASTKAVKQGGSVTIGAEQEPDCTDWIASCGGSSWAAWTILYNTLPRAFDISKQGGDWVYKPNELLTGEPTLVTSPVQTVTYHINPKAVWSDGQPITSTDFQYLAYQVRDGSDIYDKTGYKQIKTVDDSDPHTAVVTFTSPYAGWKQLFGGGYGIMPSHLLIGKDRSAIMKDGYSFSGGPYIAAWTKGDNTTLTPNPKWWGAQKSHLDKVVFKLISDTSSEFQAFKGGEVSAIYPQPQVDAVAQIKAGLGGAKALYTTDTGNIEALWINNANVPTAVRQAIGYALDRNAIVAKLFGPLGVNKAAQSLEPNLVKQYTAPTFVKYVKNLSKANSLLTGAGYVKDSNGYYAKGGKELSYTIQTTSGNARRALTEQIIQQQLQAAGIKIAISNPKANDLFGTILPGGNFDMAIYAQVLTSLEPGANTLFNSANIPTDANGQSGQNWTRTNLGSTTDTKLAQMDTELNTTQREADGKEVAVPIADQVASLPLDPLPNILIWNTKVGGPISDNPVLGPWWNLTQWGLTS